LPVGRLIRAYFSLKMIVFDEPWAIASTFVPVSPNTCQFAP